MSECDRSKLDIAVEMLKRAWKYGTRANYVLADSRFTFEGLITQVRELIGRTVHYIGLAKMGKTRYKVNGKLHNAHELVTMYTEEMPNSAESINACTSHCEVR